MLVHCSQQLASSQLDSNGETLLEVTRSCRTDKNRRCGCMGDVVKVSTGRFLYHNNIVLLCKPETGLQLRHI